MEAPNKSMETGIRDTGPVYMHARNIKELVGFDPSQNVLANWVSPNHQPLIASDPIEAEI